MATLRALLATYGALDQAIIESDDSLTKEVVDRFLPGASANREWYRELEYFFFSRADGGPNDAPDLTATFRAIAESQSLAETAPEDRLTLPQQSRLFYAMLANLQLRRVAPHPGRPRIEDDPDFVAAFIDVVNVLAPPQPQSSGDVQRLRPWTEDDPVELLTEISNVFTSSQSFLEARAFAVQKQMFD